jgi:transcription factor-like protein
MILSRLFGSKDLEALVSLPREELLNLALSRPALTSPTTDYNPNELLRSSVPDSEGIETLTALEQAPERYSEWDEPDSQDFQGVHDDVNGLSMRFDKQTSYVGISSINAALKVIFRCVPSAQLSVRSQDLSDCDSSQSLNASQNVPAEDRYAMPSREEGERLITAFYEHVHTFIPVTDEDSIRADFRAGSRKDSSWFALINSIFALGSLSAGTTENNQHYTYYTRGRRNMAPKLEQFQYPNLEILQFIAMIGGYYLHWLNRPNKADMLMGMGLRVASGLGLHREFLVTSEQENSLNVHKSQTSSNSEGQTRGTTVNNGCQVWNAEIRRRTWWTLFCLDTWQSMTTGRPSLGRISPGVTVSEPGKIVNVSGNSNRTSVRTDFLSQFSQNPQDEQSLKLLPLIHNTEFCKLATTIQDKLCATPLIPFDEVVQLDAGLVKWWQDLPSIMTKDPESSIPSFLIVPRLVMKWQYQNLRMILHRPYLLSFALRQTSYDSLTAEEKVAIGKCRLVASKTIEDITNECKSNVMCGWHAVVSP